MRNVEHPNRPIRDWSLESVIEGLQKQFLNLLTHRQVSNKFDTIEQGQKTVQELIQELTKYAAQMVQYPDDQGNLKEDVKSSASREEEIPQEEVDNLNESSGEDKEMYSWDELEYKANYVCFISNESTERQV